MRKFLMELKKAIDSIVKAVESIPGYAQFVKFCEKLVSPVVGFARGTLKLFPGLTKLEWLLEIERLTKMNPVILALLLLFTIARGLLPTQFGHIGTDTIIFGFLGAMSMFNPFLGLSLALAFVIGDYTQKIIYPDMYGATGRDMNYVGAMAGYLVAYSAPLLAGLMPGMMSRVSRLAMRKILAPLFQKKAMSSADMPGSLPSVWTVYERKLPDGASDLCVAKDMPGAEWMPRSVPVTWTEAWAIAASIGENLPAVWTVYERNVNGMIERTVAKDPPGAEWMPRTTPVTWTSAWATMASFGTPGVPSSFASPSGGGGGPTPGPGPGPTPFPGPAPSPFPSPSPYFASDLIASAIGGGLTTAAIMNIAPLLVSPAFYWRPEADVSCHNLEADKFLRGHSPVSAVETALGGTTATLIDQATNGTDPGSGVKDSAKVDPKTTKDPEIDKETGDQSRTVPTGPRPPGTMASDVIEGDKATHILVEAGLLRPFDKPDGTVGYEPTRKAIDLQGKPFTIRYGESRDPDGTIRSTQDSTYANVTGTAWELNPDGSIKGNPVIVVEHSKPAAANEGWVDWITPADAATRINNTFGADLTPGRAPDPSVLHFLEPNDYINQALQDLGPTDSAEDIYHVNGYVQPGTGDVIIGTNTGNPGTSVHELIHKTANPEFHNNVPFYLNEGMTEHFTKQITDPANINRSHVGYNANRSTLVADTIVNAVGEDIARQAYFGAGNAPVDAMRNALDARGGPGTWDMVRLLMQEPADQDATIAFLRGRIPGI